MAGVGDERRGKIPCDGGKTRALVWPAHRRAQRHQYPRFRLPLHALLRSRVAADRKPRGARLLAAGGGSPAGTLPREGEDHPGVGRSLRSGAGRANDHRLQHEPAAALLGNGADGRSALCRRRKAHVMQAATYLIRDDASTFHTYYMDVATGAPRYGNTSRATPTTPAGRAGRRGAFTVSC